MHTSSKHLPPPLAVKRWQLSHCLTQSLLISSMAFKLFLHCLTWSWIFFLLRRRHAAGRRRAARGRGPLRRSVLRLIANMTFKLFLHCLVCELEVQVEFFCCAIFFLRCRGGTAAQAGTMAAATSASPPSTRLYHIWHHKIEWHHNYVISHNGDITVFYVISYMISWCDTILPFLGSCDVAKKAWCHMVYHGKLTISHDPRNGKIVSHHDIIYDIIHDITAD